MNEPKSGRSKVRMFDLVTVDYLYRCRVDPGKVTLPEVFDRPGGLKSKILEQAAVF